MNRLSLLKQMCKSLHRFTGNTDFFRFKTNNTRSTSEFIVTEEQIRKDNFEDEAPLPPTADECCGEGCSDCVWLEYVIKLKYHTKNDKKKIKEAIDSIPEIDRRVFVELEMKRFDNL